MPLDEANRRRLRDIARESIRHGLSNHGPPALADAGLPAELREPGAVFVTLEINGRLRGCIGSLEPRRALAEDVNANAYAAAFVDPRFPPVTEAEVPALNIHIALLHPATPLPCTDEADLQRQLRPGIDGLILQNGHHRATFLPAVWADLPRPRDFLHHLKAKAGMPPEYWGDDLRFWRYEVEEV
ncbi:MAG TPA: AmmeMemoRadiSam system protein A [Kiritimatiellia bacterium]|nr:AmmeMemoRadiSam system protein A [Kiritimatiellia bacterium]